MSVDALAGFAPYFADIVGLALSAALIGGYYVFLHWRLSRHNALYTIQAVNAEARRLWVESVMRDRRDILAVQTLRNSTMAATFLASTAVLLIMGALSMSGHGSDVAHVLHSLNMTGAVDPSLWLIKLLFLVIDLCVAFFSFTLAVRKFNHVGYLLNIPADLQHPVITPRYVADFLNRAAHYYSIGMRAYYFTLPLMFWLFGPHLMVLCSLVLIFVLFRLDRAQDGGD
jgi:uncharacterized membrane protein